MTGGPDRRRALEKYRLLAPRYDRRALAIERLVLTRTRRRVVERLGPASGWTVLDVACGTGLTLARLVEAVGPRGRVIGIDQSPDMLAVARERVRAHGWKNVEFVQAAAEEARLAGPADGAILHLTHDVLRSRPAVRNVVGLIRPGGRVAAASARAASWVPRSIARAVARPYVTTFEGIDRPWTILAEAVPDLRLELLYRGCIFVAWGTITRAVAV